MLHRKIIGALLSFAKSPFVN